MYMHKYIIYTYIHVYIYIYINLRICICKYKYKVTQEKGKMDRDLRAKWTGVLEAATSMINPLPASIQVCMYIYICYT
jgi:hypothetical protein